MHYLLIILALTLSHFAHTQEALTVDLTRPTSSQDCSNGALDLHIDGDFPLYDVVWYRVSANGVEEEISIASGIQGNDDGEDLNDLVEGLYRVEVADALCGTATLEVELICQQCPDVYPYIASLSHATPASGCDDGAIDIDWQGGGNFDIVWTGPNGFIYEVTNQPKGSAVFDLSDLEPGVYHAEISTSAGSYCADGSSRCGHLLSRLYG